MNKVTILNTSIITSFGSFEYSEISRDEAKELISEGFISAVGHSATAEVLTNLLGVEIPMNRINYEQQQGDVALVFKLNKRIAEGVILSVTEIEAIGYTFGYLYRVA